MSTPSRRVALLAVVVAAAAGVAGCRRREAAAPPAPASEALELGATDLLRVRRVELARTVDVAGGLRALDSAWVKARVAGEVRSVAVREGDAVRRGQVLVRIDASEYGWRLRQAEHSAEAARAQLDIASRALANNRALVDQGFISATTLDTSVANHAAAQANLNAALAAVELARKALADTALAAPIAGVVSQRLVQPGERVSVDARLVEIVDASRIELEAAVPPADAASLRVGAVARLRVDGIAEPVVARVARINPIAQPGSRAVAAYIALPPQPALRPGLFAHGSVELERRTVLAVPASALRHDKAHPYVIVVDGARAVHTAVTPGMHGRPADGGADEWVELVAGPGEGAVLLAGSAGLVRDGAPLVLPAALAAQR